MNYVAIITARGGSKRIPKKNIKKFLGKPIIVYSIEAAIESGCYNEIMVSTDSPEIAEIAKSYGATVPFYRDESTSGDYATTSEVLVEVLNKYYNNGKKFDIATCIYPTAPFLSSRILRESICTLEKEPEADKVIPVVRFSYPPQRGVVVSKSFLHMKEPEYQKLRSQDLEPIYHDAGQFYTFRVKNFLAKPDMWAGNILPLILPEMDVQDIDTMEDWLFAEMKYKFRSVIKGENRDAD